MVEIGGGAGGEEGDVGQVFVVVVVGQVDYRVIGIGVRIAGVSIAAVIVIVIPFAPTKGGINGFRKGGFSSACSSGYANDDRR